MKPVQFDYYAPANVTEALDILAELGYDGKVLAGGQSLVAAMNFRMARPLPWLISTTFPNYPT
jgi:CO/xanthine dehydrogenase FAD-binding subunit